eukprot:4272073-Ditylum_brightwellii.AAC.1
MPHKKIVLKKDMDMYLMEYHKKHFKQAEKTSFAREPLRSLLEYSGDTAFADKIFERKANIDALKVDQYTKDFLHEIKGNPHDLPPTRPELTIQDVMQGFQLWNEKTSMLPL